MSEDNNTRDLQKEIDDLLEQIEMLKDKIVNLELTDSVDATVAKSLRKRRDRSKDSAFWGIVLISVGGFWIAKNLGWFFFDISICPVALVIIGLYMLITGQKPE